MKLLYDGRGLFKNIFYGLTNNVAFYYLPELIRKSGEQLIWKEVKERV